MDVIAVVFALVILFGVLALSFANDNDDTDGY